MQRKPVLSIHMEIIICELCDSYHGLSFFFLWDDDTYKFSIVNSLFFSASPLASECVPCWLWQCYGRQVCFLGAGGCPSHFLIVRMRPKAYCCFPALLYSCLVSTTETSCRGWGWESKHRPTGYVSGWSGVDVECTQWNTSAPYLRYSLWKLILEIYFLSCFYYFVFCFCFLSCFFRMYLFGGRSFFSLSQ